MREEITIYRSDYEQPWGFRLEGGQSKGEPLIITHVVKNSIVDGKLLSGDRLMEISGLDVTDMLHEDVVELIQQSTDVLQCTIERISNENFLTVNDEQTSTIECQSLLSSAENSSVSTEPQSSKVLYQIIEESMNADVRCEIDETLRNSSFDSNPMNRRLIAPTSDQMNPHHYVTQNPNQPFSYTQELPTSPRKRIQYDTDAITQSRSFQYLQGWISESEKKVSTSSINLTESPKSKHETIHRSSLSFLPSRSFRYLQDQYKDQGNAPAPRPSAESIHISSESRGLRRSTDAHTPSRAFKFLQDQYPVNNRDDLHEIYNRTPPCFREREPELPRYNGDKVPSRSFRFLQQMTAENSPNETLSSSFSTTFNENQFNHHPSRSFKFLQQMTGTEQSNSSPSTTATTNVHH